MFLSKESRLSARIMGHVLNFPLYDGDCSPVARELLAAGDVDGAIAEWRRLADLGSGRARCVLAYIALKGAPGAAPDVEEARRLALSALSGERGYANYVLACIALKEGHASDVVKLLGESIKAGFIPAATYLAALSVKGGHPTAKTRSGAEAFLRKAAKAGHHPARGMLAFLYLRGRFGFAKRILGLVLLMPAIIRWSLAAKYRVFSIGSFQHTNRSTQPSFSVTASSEETPQYRSVLGVTHILAAALAAATLVAQASRGRFDWTMIGWIVLAVWPYGLSYLTAAACGGGLVATAVQTLLLLLITSLTCSAYLGQLFGFPLTLWMIVLLTIAQSFLLLMACGLGASAGNYIEQAAEAQPTYRRPIAIVNVLLGLIAAGSVFARPSNSHWEHLKHYGFDVATDALLAFLPYAAVAVFSWQLVTTNKLRPWGYFLWSAPELRWPSSIIAVCLRYSPDMSASDSSRWLNCFSLQRRPSGRWTERSGRRMTTRANRPIPKHVAALRLRVARGDRSAMLRVRDVDADGRLVGVYADEFEMQNAQDPGADTQEMQDNRGTPRATANWFEKQAARQQAFEQRVQADAASFLTPVQLELLRKRSDLESERFHALIESMPKTEGKLPVPEFEC
jgi:hypothetical protein